MHNAPDRVITIKEVASRIGLSVITLQRLIRNGDGPPVTKLSTRRHGVRESHLSAGWIVASTIKAGRRHERQSDNL
jgi:predicted DNA-binding transcriptional regulator AlpA